MKESSNGFYTAPEDLTVIGDGAFSGNKSLRHIDLRNVRYIGAGAFRECSNLESVEMSNVAFIGPGAFEFCRSLRSVSFGSVTDIGDEAFLHCSMLDIPEMPRALVSVGVASFSHTDVRNVDLHWMEKIPPSVFSYCTSLSYADISCAKDIGEDAFAGCRSLTGVRMSSAEKIGDRAFYKCGLFTPGRLPDTLQSVGSDAFDCVRPGIVIPCSVREIGNNCFGPVDSRKDIRLYRSSLYCFRNYFSDDCGRLDEEDGYSHMRESVLDVMILDKDGEMTGFLPLYSDLGPEMMPTLKKAFREDNTFDYSVLDTTLFEGMRWNQRARDRLAVMRLKYPFELSGSAGTGYICYLARHLSRVAKQAVRDKDIDMLSFLFDKGLICSENILEILDHSILLEASECTAFLLKCRSEMNWQSDMIPEEL